MEDWLQIINKKQGRSKKKKRRLVIIRILIEKAFFFFPGENGDSFSAGGGYGFVSVGRVNNGFMNEKDGDL